MPTSRKELLLLFLFVILLFINVISSSPAKHDVLGWTRSSSSLSAESGSDIVLSFDIYIKQRNLDLLQAKVWEVSDPASPEYGKYLLVDEITSIVKPSLPSLSSVSSWVSSFGGQIGFNANEDMMRVRMSKKNVEKMLSVQIDLFEHEKLDFKIWRSVEEYRIPEHLKDSIDLIRKISDFPIVSKKNRVPSVHTRSAPHKPIQPVLKPSHDVGSGEPIIIEGRGRNGVITVSFIPRCSKSEVTKTVPPCKDFPPVLDSVYVTASAVHDTVGTFYSATSGPMCVSDEDGVVMCKASVNVTNYNLFNISVTSLFQSGSIKSSPAHFGYPVMASPEVLPETIRSYYGIPPGYKITSPNFTQCVVEFEQQYYDDADLRLFFDEMGLPRNTPVKVIGYNDETNPGIEANLDIQYIMGVGVGVPTVFWSIYANSTEEIDDILAWAVAMSSTVNPPIVNSLSYGMTESNVDYYLGKGYLARSDVEFQKLALRGITIIIADGDSGASDLGPPPMGQDTCFPLHADWPSQSPFVTSVSATILTPLAEPICYRNKAEGGINCDTQPLGEVPTSVRLGLPWTTGGGFANTSVMPEYQRAFVEQYVANLAQLNLLPPSGYYNAGGRVYPDVAMVGHNLLVAQEREFITVDGTSASAPIFGGLVSLLNDVRLKAGRPALGFINPLFYRIAREYPEAFFDVVYGSNNCGDVGFTPTCCPYGWHALEGFDAVSGLGTPNFQYLKEIILKY
jgi:subtilase family serine protease